MDIVKAKRALRSIDGVRVLSATPMWIALRLLPDLSVREHVVKFFHDHMATDLAPELYEQLSIALDELLGNAIEHGSKAKRTLRRRASVTLTYLRTARSIAFHLHDDGPGFSLERVSHAAVNNPPGFPLLHADYRHRLGLRPGGFGILLVKQIADELIYNEFGNEAIFIKYL